MKFKSIVLSYSMSIFYSYTSRRIQLGAKVFRSNGSFLANFLILKGFEKGLFGISRCKVEKIVQASCI